MTAREIALTHLHSWMTPAEGLPPGAALLEGTVRPTICWAIRHPETGALFGCHADPARLALLFWETLAADERYELVARGVAALEKERHLRAWKSAWHHWTRDAGARSRAVERAITAWVRRDLRDLDAALSALAEDIFPEDPADLGLGGGLPEPADARLALDYATAALVAGQVDLARHIYVYAEVAASDRGRLPALLSALTAVADHVDDQPLPPTGSALRSARRLRTAGPTRRKPQEPAT
jgi:hypothetical protein